MKIGEGTASEFFSSEFSSLNLSDIRLNKRAQHISIQMQKKPTSCIRRLYDSEKDARQAYDFYSNPKVKGSKLMNSHANETVKRIKNNESDYILAIQDQSYLNYSSHPAKTELGYINKTGKGKHNQYGLIQHSLLCVDSKNEPLGLLDLGFFHHDDFDHTVPSDKRDIQDKKTCFWINSFKKSQELLGETASKLIHVVDREGDFFEFLHELTSFDANYIIRSLSDRYTGEKTQSGKKISELLEKAPVLGLIETEINDAKTHIKKQITFKVKMIKQIIFPVPRWPQHKGKAQNYSPIKVNIVMAYNEDYCWKLLTNLQTDTLEDCVGIIKKYKERWHIEDLHKIEKTAYQIDEIYLHSSREAIETALVMASIAACRLYWIIFVGRQEQEISATNFFAENEWKAVYVYFNDPIPIGVPALREVVERIARMGGYKPNKKSLPPGAKTLWLGWQCFYAAAKMYQNLMSIKT
jgi:hypothetical protein